MVLNRPPLNQAMVVVAVVAALLLHGGEELFDAPRGLRRVIGRRWRAGW
jgi:hypothetical protein